MKTFDYADPPNPEAHQLFQSNKKEFLDRVAACVRESQEKMYENAPESSIRFTEPKPAHEHMRKSILEADEQLEGNNRDNMLESIEQAKEIEENSSALPQGQPSGESTS
mmetsp:Transcript_6931/g.9082  ORF Transcript_6931/g.9082 Transcript_6931/m.9082 type:complete len:109 (+) Transcript_6931:28-354(+)